MASKPGATYDCHIKLLIAGDDSGKSCLMSRFADDAHDEGKMPTYGLDFEIRTVEIHNKRCNLQMVDISGNDRFRPMMNVHSRLAMGILLVYDITNEQSFANIPNRYVLRKCCERYLRRSLACPFCSVA
jgi:Ras-related protein Rab-8A